MTVQHSLIHEIGRSKFGRWYERDTLGFENIAGIGETVRRIILVTEDDLRALAPSFPNFLDRAGRPFDDLWVLREEIASLERLIRQGFSEADALLDWDDLPQWNKAAELANASLEAHLHLTRTGTSFSMRIIDNSRATERLFLENRLPLLTSFAALSPQSQPDLPVGELPSQIF